MVAICNLGGRGVVRAESQGVRIVYDQGSRRFRSDYMVAFIAAFVEGVEDVKSRRSICSGSRTEELASPLQARNL